MRIYKASNKRMSKEEWNPTPVYFKKQVMDRRISLCVSYRGWQHVIKLINKLNIPFDKLKVAEVGCGTGTFSLTLGLLGAPVTLIDFNEKVIENAKKIYKLYGCKAKFIKADCLDNPPQQLAGVFDLVISNGLAEHFIGQDRERCIAYHKLLLKNGGIACIDVPNKFSPFYQFIRQFRMLTGTWRMSIEILYSDKELKRLAERSGFRHSYILGIASLGRNFIDCFRGFISAFIEVLPKILKDSILSLKNFKKNKSKRGEFSPKPEDIIRYSLNKIKSDRQEKRCGLNDILNNKLSSELILFAFT